MKLPIDTEAGAKTLRRATDLKVHVQKIVAVSRLMNMTATNALLTAKQARATTGVVGHLQRLTQQLDNGLDEILGHIERLVQELAALGRDERLPQYLESLRAMGQENQSLHGLVARRREDQGRHARVDYREDWGVLEQTLRQALQLLQAAQGVAHNTDLESGYGSEMLAGLKQTIAEVSAITVRIRSGVQQFGEVESD